MATIRQTVHLPAPPRVVYEAFLDSEQHAAFTGDEARIAALVGGRFRVFGGYAVGRTLELRRDRRIVQSWRESDWDPGIEDSRIVLELTAEPGGTRLSFRHEGVPAGRVADIRKGWHAYYWKPLRAYLRGR